MFDSFISNWSLHSLDTKHVFYSLSLSLFLSFSLFSPSDASFARATCRAWLFELMIHRAHWSVALWLLAPLLHAIGRQHHHHHPSSASFSSSSSSSSSSASSASASSASSLSSSSFSSLQQQQRGLLPDLPALALLLRDATLEQRAEFRTTVALLRYDNVLRRFLVMWSAVLDVCVDSVDRQALLCDIVIFYLLVEWWNVSIAFTFCNSFREVVYICHSLLAHHVFSLHCFVTAQSRSVADRARRGALNVDARRH
jgi:hypothetical protein